MTVLPKELGSCDSWQSEREGGSKGKRGEEREKGRGSVLDCIKVMEQRDTSFSISVNIAFIAFGNQSHSLAVTGYSLRATLVS